MTRWNNKPMHWAKLLLIVFLSSLLLAQCKAGFWQHFSNSSPKLVDEWSASSYGSLGKLAKLVCEHNKDVQLIGRISTIIKLADYFDELPRSNSQLNDCRTRYGASIKSLRRLITTSNDNVCSEEKIQAIEQFHKRFISSLDEDMILRESGEGAVPRMLMNFFVHYAVQVSRMCKESLVPILQNEVKALFPHPSDYSLSTDVNFKSDNLAGQVLGNFFSSVQHYEDVLVVWDLVGKGSEGEKSMLVDTINEKTGEQVKLLIVSKNIVPLLSSQEKCRKRFKPVYSQVILPVARLANLGYSFSDVEVEMDEQQLLLENKQVELWYRLTQFCESILPVQFLQDDKLEDEKATGVITLEEREKYLQATEATYNDVPQLELIQFEPPKGLNYLAEDEDKLRTLTQIDGGLQVIKAKDSASAKSRNLRQFMTRSLHGLKRMYSGNLHMSHQLAQSLGLVKDQQVTASDHGDFVVADVNSLMNDSGSEGSETIRGLKRRTRDLRKKDGILWKIADGFMTLLLVATLITAIVALLLGFGALFVG